MVSGRYIEGKVRVRIDISRILSAIDDVEEAETDRDREIDYEMDGEDICLSIPIKAGVKETFYPGVRTLSNGDPGYPDEYEIEDLVNETEISDSIELEDLDPIVTIFDWSDEVKGEERNLWEE
jgi:hypothetical protein